MASDTKIINLHLAQDFYARMKERADAQGSTVTGYIRLALASYIDHSTDDKRLLAIMGAYQKADDEHREWLAEAARMAAKG